MRKEWTFKGLRNHLEPRDLSHVRAVNYRKKNEAGAAERYAAVLRNLGHAIVLQHSGLLVHPSYPWLEASPDKLIFDPEEHPAHGVLEIKCPYLLKDSDLSKAKGHSFYIRPNENGMPHLKRNSEQYYQILGQMALSGCMWGDFFVPSEQWMIIERIRFDPSK